MLGSPPRKLIIALAASPLLFGLPAEVHSQVVDTNPDSVAQAFLDALADEDWDLAAALVHPELRREHKEARVEMFRCFAGDDTATVEAYLETHPSTSRERARRRVASINRWLQEHRKLNRLEDQYPMLGSLDEFETLSPEKVMALELKLHHGRPWDDVRARVLGHVREGPWANVVYRYLYEYDGGDPARSRSPYRHVPHVLMLREDGDAWRVGSLFGIGDRSDYGPGTVTAMRENAGTCPPVLRASVSDSTEN